MSLRDHMQFAERGDRITEPDPIRLAPLLAGQRVLGVVRSYNTTSGFGFIVCKETQELMGEDCFIQRAEAEPIGATIGATVSFQVELNKDGRPRAKNVKLEARGVDRKVAEETRKEERIQIMLEELADKVLSKFYYGTVKSYNSTTGFGFISCEETHNIFGRDVFLHGNNLAGFNVGDAVAFKLNVDTEKGTAQARDLKQPPEMRDEIGADIGSSGISMLGMLGMMSMLGMDKNQLAAMFGVTPRQEEEKVTTEDLAVNASGMSNYEWKQRLGHDNEIKEERSGKMEKLIQMVESKQRFVGIIRCWNRARGFGFIGCEETQLATGSDVFLHNEQRLDFDVGDIVSFSMELRGTQARAKDLRPSKGTGDTGERSPPRYEDDEKRARLRRELPEMRSTHDGMCYTRQRSRSRSAARRAFFNSKKR